ncbi:MAG TPA: Rieske 2Fe-2S domain-containing protein [Streptosporangiaceae bacterium]
MTSAPQPPGGWQLLALDNEITGQVTALELGSRALVAIRDGGDGRVRVFDGTCPHRGAHLGYGGRVSAGQTIICPFHGKRIGLGSGTGRLCVREHETIDCGGAVFIRLSDVPARDLGFESVLREISATHVIVGAVMGEVRIPPELVIENAFDFSHFPTVHLIPKIARPKVWTGDAGELNITTAFITNAPDWETAEGEFTSDFHARAFSPHLVVSRLGPVGSAKFVITGAVPAPGGCVARIAIAVRGEEPQETVSALVEGSKIAFDEDLVVWNHLDLDAPCRLDIIDAPVLAFRAFCASFTAPPVQSGGPAPAAEPGGQHPEALAAAGLGGK